MKPRGESDPPEVLVDSAAYYIEGKIEDYVVVSVPETTSFALAEKIEQAATQLTGKPVCVISHNVSLLRAVKLTAQEAAKVVKQGDIRAT